MNIAIIIAVSNYTYKSNNLPGCKNDADAINQILRKTEKYDDILYLNNNETSGNTKELLSNFFLKFKGYIINELFLYYSGHGEFSNDEFYYILSDFDSKKKNQTSLQNSEIDDLIRTLSPELVIKVIDACQSGTTYIKEENILNKYFNESKKGFQKCYFLNSSLNNQSSFQNEHLSFFTFSFIKALKEHKTKEIRYKDIIDVISDEFSENQEQTPFFVIQADLTEKFCSFTTDLRDYLDSLAVKHATDEETKEIVHTLSDLVKIEAKEYVDKQGAINAIKFVENELKTIALSSELKQLYNLEITFHPDYKLIPQTKVIGKWLTDNKHEYFSKVIYEEKFDEESGTEYVDMTGFDLKFETPFKAISVDINRLYPNLSSYQCNIVFLISKKLITFFYFVSNFIDESWEIKYLNLKGIKWLYTERKISDKSDIAKGIDFIKQKIESTIWEELNGKFGTQPPFDDLPF